MGKRSAERRVLIAVVCGGRVHEARLGEWREGGLGRQRDDDGGCAAMRES